ncbi:MAG: NAD-dependent succinate-semialdehyde dehydrogenase [Alphaproteobacteria bacterium]
MYTEALGQFVAGEWRTSVKGGRCEPVYNPANDEVLATLPHADKSDIEDALESAAKGFEAWRRTSAWVRSGILLRAADIIAERKEALAQVLTLENGKPIADARGEIDRVTDTIRWCAEEAKRTYGRILPPRREGLMQATLKRPVGPVAGFAPWNFPAVLMVRKLAAALAAGCSIVMKPAEECPAVCVGIVRAFADAGVPRGVINMLFGVPAEISEALIDSPVIRKVSFTGSVPVGKLLSRMAGERLKPVTMELGGHSPVLVFNDSDVDAAAKTCATFKYRNAGQVCISPNRIFVQAASYERFLDRFVETAKSIRVGDGMDAQTQMGPLTNTRRLEAAENFVGNARAKGAEIRLGGNRIGNRGLFFEPTVLTDVSDDAEIMREEPFVPVVPILPFETVEDGLKKANAVPFGLAAYAFTRSTENAIAVAEGFEAGWIGINDFTPALEDAPICGQKDSGLGCEGGPEGLDSYLHTRFVSQAPS